MSGQFPSRPAFPMLSLDSGALATHNETHDGRPASSTRTGR